ncbi:hypothetical protein [Clostridium transplantifaecale]|uniref:hypothetical protein n=1 Tax=Clostridium transplantifaecale TaxID=2479838 RepID=UPI0013DDA13B|nr:hypothetical protein [Clostridium transplantifaecale]
MITESPGWWKRIVRRAAEDGLRAALPKYGWSAYVSAGSVDDDELCAGCSGCLF